MVTRAIDAAAYNFQHLDNYLNRNDPHPVYGTNMRTMTNTLVEGKYEVHL